MQQIRNELGVSAIKIHTEATLRKHELCMKHSEVAQCCCVTGELCMGSVVVWWCLLAVWQGVMFPGLQEDVEIENRPASLAQAAQHIKNVLVGS